MPEAQVHDSLTTELVGRPSAKLPSYAIADDPLVQVWILHHKLDPTSQRRPSLTGTNLQPINILLAPLLPAGEYGDGWMEPDAAASAQPEMRLILSRNPVEMTGEVGFDRTQSHGVAAKKTQEKGRPRR